MKTGDQVTTQDGRVGTIIEVLDRYVTVDTGDTLPRAYIKREVKQVEIPEDSAPGIDYLLTFPFANVRVGKDGKPLAEVCEQDNK